jgi:hypothetical protein
MRGIFSQRQRNSERKSTVRRSSRQPSREEEHSSLLLLCPTPLHSFPLFPLSLLTRSRMNP